MKNAFFLTTVFTVGLAASLLLAPKPALADDCLLDRDNDGVVDAGTDNDGGANSNNDDTSTACGVSATATGGFATAIGSFSNATADRTIAIGRISNATAADASAVGHNAQATAANSLAVGQSAFATARGAVALGQAAAAGGIDSSAIGFRAFAPVDGTIVLGQIPGVNSGLGYTQVANGTTDPLAPLHLFRDDATQEMLYLESNEIGTEQDRAMMYLANNGGIRFEFANEALSSAWRFQAATGNRDRFEVTKVGTGQIEFWIDALGNGFIAGDLDVGGNVLTNVLLPSDKHIKQNIEAIDAEAVLEKVAALPVTAWEYTDRPGERHIGPMAQDFQAAFGLGQGDTSISVVDASGVALASIRALNEKLEAHNSALRAQNAELEERLALVEALVTQLLPRTAQN